MPVASPAPYLGEALASCVAQTFSDWELVLVLDGPGPEILEQAEAVISDGRLRVVQLPVRRGIAAALNAGIDASRSELLARIDADDRNAPDRLELQVAYLDAHPSVLVLGGSACVVDEAGEYVGLRRTHHGTDLRESLLRRNQLVHSSVLMRRSAVVEAGGYDIDALLREDYDLWLRVGCLGGVENLERTVVDYRVSPHQASRGATDTATLRRVQRSRLALARHLGADVAAARLRGLAWATWQRPSVASLVGLSRRIRGRDGRRSARGKGVRRRTVCFPVRSSGEPWQLASLPVAQQRMTRTLAAIVEVSESQNYPCVLIAGSALGARRHGGFIHWDDDIDLAVPLEMFDQFCESVRSALPPSLLLRTRSEDPVLGADAKVYDLESLTQDLFGETHGLLPPLDQGLFVDIFPLAPLSRFKSRRSLERAAARLCYVRPQAGLMRRSRALGARRRLAYAAVSLIPIGATRRMQALLRERADRRTGADLVGIGIAGVNGPGPLSVSMLLPGSPATFNGTRVYVPAELDAYLAQTFGTDFLTPRRTGESHSGRIFVPGGVGGGVT